MEKALGNRLKCAADLIRRGSVFADIGSDHGYLSAYLAKNGLVSCAYACDISLSSVKKAEETIINSGAQNCYSIHSDGFEALKFHNVTDFAVCGMGGELISSLLDKAPFVYKKGNRFVFQPMSHSEDLRRYLSSNGFAIVYEALLTDAGRHYEVICAEYTGENYILSPLEYSLGKDNIARGGDELISLISRRLLYYTDMSKTCDIEKKKKAEEMISLLKELKIKITAV